MTGLWRFCEKEETLSLRTANCVANHIRLENEHQWADVKNTMVQDDRAFCDFVAVGQFKGVEGVGQFYQAVSTAFPDLHVEITAQHDLPGCSIREGYITGTHLGEYMGIPASGVSVQTAIAVFFIFDKISGELLGERLYMDHGAVLLQLQRKTAAAAQ
jgi:steroid delta-isomerase-like uncharacterized protein